MRKIALMAMLLFAAAGSTFAQNTDVEESEYQFKRGIFDHVGVNVGVGLEGISVGVAAPITNFVEMELGLNMMPGFNISGDVDIPASSFDYTQGGQTTSVAIPDSRVKAEGKFSRTTVNLKAYVYPFGNNTKFFIAGGLSMGGKKIAKVSGRSDDLAKFAQEYPEYRDQIIDAVAANLGGYKVTLNNDFSVDADVRCNNVRPYVGLGFGRLVPKNRIGFRFELGCQFMGSLKVYENGQKVDIDQMLKDAGNDDISKFIKNFKVYPCLKFSLVGRIL